MALGFTPAEEGYFRKETRRGTCGVCKKKGSVCRFTRKTRDAHSPDGLDLSTFKYSLIDVCSFACFKQSKEYVGPNPPLEQR